MSWYDDGKITNEDMLRIITNVLAGLPDDDEDDEDEPQLTEVGSNPMGEPVFRDHLDRICTFDNNGSLLYETAVDDRPIRSLEEHTGLSTEALLALSDAFEGLSESFSEWDEDELPRLDLSVSSEQDGIDIANHALAEWHQMGAIDLLSDEKLEIKFDWGSL